MVLMIGVINFVKGNSSISTLDTLYYGVQTIVKEDSLKDGVDSLMIKGDGALIERIDSTTFLISPIKEQTLLMEVYSCRAGVCDLIESKILVVDSVPNPCFDLLGVRQGRINKEQLIVVERLNWDIKHPYYFPRDFYKILSFEWSLVNNEGKLLEWVFNDGAYLSAEIKSRLNHVEEGDVMIFSNIKVLGNDGVERICEDVVIKVE